MKWAEVSIRTSHEETDLIAEIFHDVGASGVVIEDPEELNSYIESGLFDYSDLPKAEQTNVVTIKAYLPVDEDLDERLRTFEQRVRDLAKIDGFDAQSCRIEWHTVQDEDWADNWKAYFHTEKVERNHVENRVTTGVSDLLKAFTGKADLIIANIIADIVIRLFDELDAHLDEGGHLLASGIIDERVADVTEAALAHGFAIDKVVEESGWAAMVISREDAK